jgi:hypothetical protein
VTDHATSDKAERDILACLIVNVWSLASLGNLKPIHFRNRDRAEVYRAILETRADGIVLVAAELRRRGIPPPGTGWNSVLSGLTDGPPGGYWYVDEENLPAYSRIVQEAAAQRLRTQIRAVPRMAVAE